MSSLIAVIRFNEYLEIRAKESRPKVVLDFAWDAKYMGYVKLMNISNATAYEVTVLCRIKLKHGRQPGDIYYKYIPGHTNKSTYFTLNIASEPFDTSKSGLGSKAYTTLLLAARISVIRPTLAPQSIVISCEPMLAKYLAKSW